jgi:hypothetical protein
MPLSMSVCRTEKSIHEHAVLDLICAGIRRSICIILLNAECTAYAFGMLFSLTDRCLYARVLVKVLSSVQSLNFERI